VHKIWARAGLPHTDQQGAPECEKNVPPKSEMIQEISNIWRRPFRGCQLAVSAHGVLSWLPTGVGKKIREMNLVKGHWPKSQHFGQLMAQLGDCLLARWPSRLPHSNQFGDWPTRWPSGVVWGQTILGRSFAELFCAHNSPGPK
jgi:hypothetical protein